MLKKFTIFIIKNAALLLVLASSLATSVNASAICSPPLQMFSLTVDKTVVKSEEMVTLTASTNFIESKDGTVAIQIEPNTHRAERDIAPWTKNYTETVSFPAPPTINFYAIFAYEANDGRHTFCQIYRHVSVQTKP
ncbi:hypothetical protein BH09PAT2_BH09PAT2_09220 [soil metagenome]